MCVKSVHPIFFVLLFWLCVWYISMCRCCLSKKKLIEIACHLRIKILLTVFVSRHVGKYEHVNSKIRRWVVKMTWLKSEHVSNHKGNIYNAWNFNERSEENPLIKEDECLAQSDNCVVCERKRCNHIVCVRVCARCEGSWVVTQKKYTLRNILIRRWRHEMNR